MLVAAGVALVFLIGGDNDKSSSTQTATAQGDGTPATGAGTGPGPRPTMNGTDPGIGGATAPTGQGGPGQVVPINPNGGPPPLATGPNAPIITPRDQPRGTTAAGGAPTGAGSSSNYTIDDVRVRDHRGSGSAPLDIPPNIHTPEGPRINSTLTNEIATQVRAIMNTCAKGVSREGRGESPRVEGLLVTTVKANQLGVLSATIQVRDVPETTAATVKSCMEPKIVALTAPAPDQADLDSYSVSMRMTLP